MRAAPYRESLVASKQPGKVQIRGNYALGTFLNEEEWGQMPLRPGTETIGTLMLKAGYELALNRLFYSTKKKANHLGSLF